MVFQPGNTHGAQDRSIRRLGRRRRRTWGGGLLAALALWPGAPARSDQALSDFQIAVLERQLATLRAPLRAAVDVEPPEGAEGGATEPGPLLFAEPVAAGDWTTVGARLTYDLEEVLASRRDALLPAEGEPAPADAAAAGYRLGPYRAASRFFLVERVLPPRTVSETERLGPLSIRIWVTPERRDALELFHLRSGGAVPPPRERPTPPRDDRFDVQAGGPGDAEQQYRLRTAPADAAPIAADEPGAGGDRLGIQRANVVIEAGRDTLVRSGDDPGWKTAGMSEADERALTELIGALAAQLWEASEVAPETGPPRSER